MPKAIFERHGFVEVGQAGTNGLVFFKEFEKVEAPCWIEKKLSFNPIEGKLLIDIYHNDRCPIHWRNTQLVKEIAEEFDPTVEVRVHSTDDRAEMQRHGTAYTIYLNGKLIAAGPLADRAKIRDKIKEEMKKL